MTHSTIHYGAKRAQVGELWLPKSASRPTREVPVVVLIHGGFWRARYTKVLMRSLARSVTSRGWAAWNIEYRRVGAFGGGGGWPATFADVAAAVDSLEQHDGLDLGRVVTCGHSAGGLLALWSAARHRLDDEAPGGQVRVPVRAAVSLAGVTDLRWAYDGGEGAVSKLLGGSPEAVPEHYAYASPGDHLPLGVPQVLIHGLGDTVVSPAMSDSYATRATAAGDDAMFVPVPGSGHRDMLARSGAGWSATLVHLERLFT